MFQQTKIQRASNNMYNKNTIPTKILDDLLRRFVLNVPVVERSDAIKFFVHIEKSHWFYLDTFCMANQNLTKLKINEFAAQIFHHVPFLRVHLKHLNEILQKFEIYKKEIPTYGAILLSTDFTHVLLVKSYCAKGLWGFPKGKIEEFETSVSCAIREVYEETSYDVSTSINPDWYIEGKWSNALMSGYTGMYIIKNVPMETHFAARTKNEIESYNWFRLDDLFRAKRGYNSGSSFSITSNTFFMKNRLESFLNDKTNEFPISVTRTNYKKEKRKCRMRLCSLE